MEGQMKINGTVVRRVKNKLVEFDVFAVTLKDGPMKGKPSIVGNSTVLFSGGHRYELNADGDFVFSPQGQN